MQSSYNTFNYHGKSNGKENGCWKGKSFFVYLFTYRLYLCFYPSFREIKAFKIEYPHGTRMPAYLQRVEPSSRRTHTATNASIAIYHKNGILKAKRLGVAHHISPRGEKQSTIMGTSKKGSPILGNPRAYISLQNFNPLRRLYALCPYMTFYNPI